MPTKKAAKNATPAVTPNANKMSIYTRFGDKGKTSLYGGKTVSKGSLRVDAYGSLDELNSAVGVALLEIKDPAVKKELVIIQNDLFEIGASLASSIKNIKLEKYLEKRVKDFEKQIDHLSGKLPELMNFILPGGGKGGSFLHLARTVCRRAERRITELAEAEEINGKTIVYINRLSDLLFTYARFINYKEKKKEIIWSKR